MLLLMLNPDRRVSDQLDGSCSTCMMLGEAQILQGLRSVNLSCVSTATLPGQHWIQELHRNLSMAVSPLWGWTLWPWSKFRSSRSRSATLSRRAVRAINPKREERGRR